MIELELEKLKRFGISQKKINPFQILCLPENLGYVSQSDELFDSAHSIDLSKKLKAAGVECANPYDLGIEAGVIERRSSEVWLGLVWILDTMAIPIFVSVVSGILVYYLKKRSKQESSAITEPQIHLELQIFKGDNFTNFKYKGDSETLDKILKAIELSTKSDK